MAEGLEPPSRATRGGGAALASLLALWLSAHAATSTKHPACPKTPIPYCLEPAQHEAVTAAPMPTPAPVPDTRGTSQQPLTVQITQLPATERTVDWTERVAAYATVFLGVVTLLLWLATRGLVRGADETAKRELRAYVFIHSARLRHLDTDPLSVIVELKNTGKTPAYNVRVRGHGAIAESGENLPPLTEQPEINNGHLGPDAPTSIRIPPPPPTPEQIQSLVNRQATLFTRGEVRYVDAFRRPHFLRFTLTASGPDETKSGAPVKSAPGSNETDDVIDPEPAQPNLYRRVVALVTGER